MNSNAYFIQMDFVSHRFHIYFGDMNDPNTWKYTGQSFYTCIDADDALMQLEDINPDNSK